MTPVFHYFFLNFNLTHLQVKMGTPDQPPGGVEVASFPVNPELGGPGTLERVGDGGVPSFVLVRGQSSVYEDV